MRLQNTYSHHTKAGHFCFACLFYFNIWLKIFVEQDNTIDQTPKHSYARSTVKSTCLKQKSCLPWQKSIYVLKCKAHTCWHRILLMDIQCSGEGNNISRLLHKHILHIPGLSCAALEFQDKRTTKVRKELQHSGTSGLVCLGCELENTDEPSGL